MKIMIIQQNHLGDIILATPFVKTMRNTFTNDKIILVVQALNRSYIHNCSFVDEIIYTDTIPRKGFKKITVLFKNIIKIINYHKNNNIDLLIELTGQVIHQFYFPLMSIDRKIGQSRTKKNIFLHRYVNSGSKEEVKRNNDVLALLNVNVKEEKFPAIWFPGTKKEEDYVNKLLVKYKLREKRIALVHMVAPWHPREWPAERFLAIAVYLVKKGIQVIFIGSKKEKERINKIIQLKPGYKNKFYNFSGLTNIKSLATLMKKSELMIANDSGPAHLALSANLKSVIIFGPGDHIRWGHPDKQSVVIDQSYHCTCRQYKYSDRCEKGYSTCQALKNISIEHIKKEIDKIIK